MKRDPYTVSNIMRRVKSKNTLIEIKFRNILWNSGFRYRKNCDKILGKPDLVSMKFKIAIFIDGDFWHGNQYKNRGFDSLEEQLENVSNKNYWINKIKRNVERDRLITDKLQEEGWLVIRIWESQIKQDINKYIIDTLSLINKRKSEYAKSKIY